MSVELSIIVPAYNAERYLSDCLNSILASTYRNFEILLINDGSTDRTREICNHFQLQHPKIKVFHTENRGLPSARNLGIENASGRFVGFVDADDLITPDMFELLVRCMKHDVQLSACKFHRCMRGEVPSISGERTLEAIEYNQVGTAELILRGGAGPFVWNKLYRKDVLDANNIRFKPDGQGAEDQFFNAEYLQYCTKAAFYNREMYFYVTTEGSIMNTFRQSRVVSRRYVSLPRAWRFTAEVMEGISEELVFWSRSRSAMFYQTVLRKLEKPDEAYIQEAVSYVKQYKNTLLHYGWGIKYYLSALVLCTSYNLWAKIFRRGL